MERNEVYIASALRTPVGKAHGVFAKVRPDDLLVHCLKGIMQQNKQLDAAAIEDVIIGCAMPEAEQGMNVARNALLLAGLPDTVPGMTVNRFCSSGLQTIAMAADRIALGDADVIIAGGVESMTMVPMGGHKMAPNPKLISDPAMTGIAYSMGITAEKVAEKWEITRVAQDEYALESHNRALQAIASDAFKDEILPYQLTETYLDEGPRVGSTMEKLAKLPTVFRRDGTVTAANTSQMSDGAAAVLVVSKAALEKYNLTPLAKFLGFSVAGVAPQHMGIGPTVAIPKVLNKLGLSLEQIDWIELNEAFAAQALAVIKDLRLDKAKVNPIGSAIALGHPLGATGAIRTCTLVHGLRREQKNLGMVTMCIGTGMGAAGVFERVS